MQIIEKKCTGILMNPFDRILPNILQKLFFYHQGEGFYLIKLYYLSKDTLE